MLLGHCVLTERIWSYHGHCWSAWATSVYATIFGFNLRVLCLANKEIIEASNSWSALAPLTHW